MPTVLIVQLLATFGPAAIQLIDQLIKQWQSNAPVTPEQWAALSLSLKQTANDRMKADLTAAGVDLTSPQAIALLGLAK